MEDSIEEDMAKVNTYIELVSEKDYCNCNEFNTILGKHCDGSKNVAYAMQHILSDYKRVLKENEELNYKLHSKKIALEIYNRYISKSKIKAKIEQLKMNANYDWMYKYDYQDVVKMLQELLEEGE